LPGRCLVVEKLSSLLKLLIDNLHTELSLWSTEFACPPSLGLELGGRLPTLMVLINQDLEVENTRFPTLRSGDRYNGCCDRICLCIEVC